MEGRPIEPKAEEISESVVRTAAYYIWKEKTPLGPRTRALGSRKAELASEFRTENRPIQRNGSVSNPAVRKIKPAVKSSIRALRSKQVTA